MSKGKKIGGIILIIIGTIFLVIGLAIGGLFGAMNGAMDEAVAELEQQIEDARRTGVSTYGEIIDIDSENMATIEFYCEEDGYWYETYMMVMSDDYEVGGALEVIYDPYRLNDSDYVPMVPVLYLDAVGVVGDTVPGVGIGVGVVFGVIGLIMLVIGIVLLVSNKKDKQWTDDIKARNASQGVGNIQYNNYQQPGGQPLSGYQQPGGQPLSGYQQPGGQNGYSSNPYQQNNNNQNM